MGAWLAFTSGFALTAVVYCAVTRVPLAALLLLVAKLALSAKNKVELSKSTPTIPSVLLILSVEKKDNFFHLTLYNI